MIDPTEHQYSISVTALIFFDQSAKWLRHKDQRGWLEDSEGPIGDRSEVGDRQYTLTDVKRIAVALRRKGIIDNTGLENCLIRIEAMQAPVYRRRKQR